MPILAIVRVPAVIAGGIPVGTSILAGLGAARLTAALPARLTPWISGALIALPLLEFVVAPLGRIALGADHRLEMRAIAPPQRIRAAYDAFDRAKLDGAVVDIPLSRNYYGMLPGRELATYVFYAGYHSRPTTSCYNSYMPQTLWSVQAITERLPAVEAVRDLEAAGLRNLVMHEADDDFVESMQKVPGVRVLYRERGIASFRLDGQGGQPVRELGALSLYSVRFPPKIQSPPGNSFAVYVDFTNESDRPWRNPEPVTPLDAEIVFAETSGAGASFSRAKKILPPLGVTAGGRGAAIVLLGDEDLPPPGRYYIDISIPNMEVTVKPSNPFEVIMASPGR
jgi:hypothetical protein